MSYVKQGLKIVFLVPITAGALFMCVLVMFMQWVTE